MVSGLERMVKEAGKDADAASRVERVLRITKAIGDDELQRESRRLLARLAIQPSARVPVQYSTKSEAKGLVRPRDVDLEPAAAHAVAGNGEDSE